MAGEDPFSRIAQQSTPIQRGIQYNPNPEFQQALADWTNNAMAYGFRPDPFGAQSDIGNSELRFAQTMKSIMDQQMAAHQTNNIAALPGYLYNFMAGMQPLMTGGVANAVLGNTGQFDNGYKQGPLTNDLSMSPMVAAYRAALQNGANGGPGGASAPAPNVDPASAPGPVQTSGTAPNMNNGIMPGGSDSHSPGGYPGDMPAGSATQNIVQGLMAPGANPAVTGAPTPTAGPMPGPSMPPSNIPPQSIGTPGPVPGSNPAVIGTPGPQNSNAGMPPANGAVSSTNMPDIMRAVMGTLMQVLMPALAGAQGLPGGPQMQMNPRDMGSIVPGMQAFGR